MIEAIVSELRDKTNVRIYARNSKNSTHFYAIYQHSAHLGILFFKDQFLVLSSRMPQTVKTIDIYNPNIDIIEEIIQFLKIKL